MQKQEISIGWAMTQPDVSAALDRVLANIRSLSDKSRTWLDAGSNYFPPFSLLFGRKVLSLPMLTNGESIRSVGHRLIVRQYCRAFFMPLLYRIGGCHSVNEISPTGEVVICKQRDVQPLSVSPCRAELGDAYK